MVFLDNLEGLFWTWVGYHTLCEVWREPERRVSLRIVALLSIGAMRLAIESWTAENYKGSALYHFENAFINLKKGLEEI